MNTLEQAKAELEAARLAARGFPYIADWVKIIRLQRLVRKLTHEAMGTTESADGRDI